MSHRNRNMIRYASLAVLFAISAQPAFSQRRPAPSPSRYSYELEIDAKSLPKGVTVRTVKGDVPRYFARNVSSTPLVINERYQLERLVSGTKLVSGNVYQYFPNGVPMEGKRHLKGWQAPFGPIKESLLMLSKPPKKISDGRKAGLSKAVPPAEVGTIPAKYDGKPYQIKVLIKYRLNPKYDTYYADR